MSERLDSTDFDRFFRAVRTGFSRPTPEQLAAAPGPFPWQQRLVEELLAGSQNGRPAGRWPELLDLPTGSGKTATIDMALFALACRDDAPRRVVFVVDRRVVVQQAASWARDLAQQLNNAQALPGKSDPVVDAVARRLAAKSASVPLGDESGLGEGGRAIIAAELRGGIAADTAWVRRPDIPTIITSTVDQVGSRLLMQGYGVSESMRPVHAGLFANDVLFLLDEVHLSQPFADTLAAVGKYRERTRESVWPGHLNRWQVVQLSATPHTRRPTQRFSLTAADRTGVLGQRLAARKPASVLLAPKARADAAPNAAMARFLVDCALSAAERQQPAVIAVVANRVAIATGVASRLRREFESKLSTDRPAVLLLTGRMRPYERDRVLAENLPLVTTGRDRGSLTRHVFVVGTQSIEAGVDFDVDALLTQAASLDALKQRFGRVDRRGELAAAGRPSSNVIVCSAPTRQVGPDPVYGEALAKTEQWLAGQEQVDFGIDHLIVDPVEQQEMCPPARSAPSLLPTHLDAWAQNPTPHFAPEIAAWLHGPDSEADPDVSVVWRDGLVDRDRVFVEALLEAIPIRSDEAVDVPRSHVRRWLRHGRSPDDLADVEGVDEAANDRGSGQAPRRYQIVTPDGTVTGGRFSAIRPGDTVIVDGAEGGLTLGSWDPAAIDPVQDLSAVPRHSAPESSPILSPARLDRVLAEIEEHVRSAAGKGNSDEADQLRAWSASCPVPVDDPDLPPATAGDVRQWLDEIPLAIATEIDAGGQEPMHLRALRSLASDGRLTIIEIPSMDTPGTIVFAPGAGAKRSPNSDREASSTIGVRVELSAHGEDTAQWAAAFLRALHVPDDAIAEHPVTVAARYHDIGKADRRFQLQLWEGQVNDLLLAKSAIPADDWRRRRAARASSGYPAGARHELLSASMLLGTSLLERSDGDGGLIGHLIATHHGVGRPFAPAMRSADADGPGDREVQIGECAFTIAPHDMISVGSPLAEWFWHSVREHGWFGNAWFTALLRLADHQASRFPTGLVEGDTNG